MTDTIEEIRERHDEWERIGFIKAGPAAAIDAHTDRATLLRALDAERARRVEVEGALRESIPQEIVDVAVRVGFGEWGSTAAKSAEDHAADTASSVKLTAEHFQQEGNQAMHGVYIAGTETVICHTGTSPNSPQIARALTGVWNKLVELSMQRSATHKDTQDE